jgi:hypothetical protein
MHPEVRLIVLQPSKSLFYRDVPLAFCASFSCKPGQRSILLAYQAFGFTQVGEFDTALSWTACAYCAKFSGHGVRFGFFQ